MVSVKIYTEFDVSKEKDEFERIKYEINHKMNQVKTFLQERQGIENETDAKKILQKQSLNKKIDDDLQAIKKNLDQLSTVYESQKKKKNKVKYLLFSTQILKKREMFFRA